MGRKTKKGDGEKNRENRKKGIYFNYVERKKDKTKQKKAEMTLVPVAAAASWLLV